MQTIKIDPVTRIEGHAKITIDINDSGEVDNAHFHVTQFRGFEKFLQGRPFSEMASLTARTCGICPISHEMSAGKAGDRLLAVEIPENAKKLRAIVNLGQIVQSHALSFFHLSSADFVYGFDANPSDRSIFNMINTHPEMAKEGIRLRKWGQQVIERIAGKRIHPAWVVPGGVSAPLEAQTREQILSEIPEMKTIARKALSFFKKEMGRFNEEVRALANFPSLFLGLVDENGELDHYDGKPRIVNEKGEIIADRLDPQKYHEYIGEHVEEHSYLKSPYYIPYGYDKGMYRVGPLARLNVCDKCGTPEADSEWAEFRSLERNAILSSFHYHYARLIEIMYGIEKIEQLLSEESILDRHVRSFAQHNRFEAVGMSEAPRGMLLHHYKIDEHGIVNYANLIIATGHNNLAMGKGILQAAKHFVDGKNIKEGALNRVEAVIRCFDPCLSCSTHAAGKMPLNIEIRDKNQELIDRITRD
ncbi:MAG: Ni/Fe hydrogenase subunit alpha [Campylobacterales bacterium]